MHNSWLASHGNRGLPATLVELFLLVQRKAPQKKDPLRELRAKAASTSEKFLVQVRNRASNSKIFLGSRLVFASLFSRGNPIRGVSIVLFLRGTHGEVSVQKLPIEMEESGRRHASTWMAKDVRHFGGLFLPQTETGGAFFAALSFAQAKKGPARRQLCRKKRAPVSGSSFRAGPNVPLSVTRKKMISQNNEIVNDVLRSSRIHSPAT